MIKLSGGFLGAQVSPMNDHSELSTLCFCSFVVVKKPLIFAPGLEESLDGKGGLWLSPGLAAVMSSHDTVILSRMLSVS